METTATRHATYAPGQRVHVFELAGLGIAPYVLTGVEHKVFKAHPDAPSQPGSSCDYCGTGICFLFFLRSADGKRFKVGSDCILKTSSDRALRVAVKTEVQKREQELRAARRVTGLARDEARVASAVARLPQVADGLRSQPHPYAARGAFFAEKTLLDWVEWMLAHSGMSGKVTAARAIERALDQG